MTENDMKGSTFEVSRFERKIFPQWLFHPGNEEEKRIAALGYSTVFIAIIALAFHAVVAFIRHDTALGIADLLLIFVLAGILLYHRQTTSSDNHAAVMGVSAFAIFCFYLFFSGETGGATFVWYYIFPLMTSFILGARRGAIAAILLLVPTVLALVLERHIPFFTPLPLGVKLRFVSSFLVVTGLSYLYERNREKTYQQLNRVNIELHKSNEEMEQRINKRTEELQQANLHLLQEIQDHKRAEEQRRQAEEMFRTMADTSRAAVVIMQGGYFVYANENAALYAGYAAGELAGVKALSLVHPDDVESVKQYAIRVSRGGHSTPREYRIVRKGGDVRWIMETLTPIMYQGKRAILGNAMDVTERKAVEARLRESEEKYRFITEKMSDIVWTTDLSLSVTFVSPSVEKVLGFSPEESKVKPLHEKLTPESLHYVVSALAQEIERDQNKDVDPDRTATVETQYYHKNGSVVWLENVVNAIRDGKGNILGIHGVSRDITQRKALEAQLLQAQKMEAIGTLAGGIAHDFNNLLFGILGHASLMEMDPHVTQNQKERLRSIEDLVKSASGLTNQLLGFARKGRYEVRTADVNELLEKTVSMFGRTRKEITIHKRYSENLMPVEADRTQMEQVFMNLFVNAWQAMPGGGGIYIDTSNVTIRADETKYAYMIPGRYVRISVTDTGVGMDETTKNRIFEPFFTTKEMGRGTGLGLAMVYGIVRGHDGYIDVYSEKGHGTTFIIHLPASQKEMSGEPRPLPEPQTGHETILIIDDEKVVMDVTREILEMLGYEVLIAGSGQEAVETYKANRDRIALVILDLIMPGMGGSEAFDRLREINPDVKVILSSGYSINGLAREVMEKGCQAFIQKPVNIAELSRKVRDVLESE